MADVAARDAVWLDVLPSMKNFGPALAKGAGAEADKQGKSVGQRYGKAMLAGVAVVGGGAILAGKALYSIGETFDDMTDNIRIGTGAVGKDLDALVASAKKVGTEVPAEYDQVGIAVADLNTRLGLTGKPLEEMSGQFLELARITGGDLPTQIAKGTRVFGDWQIATEDQGEALDHLFKVSQATGIEFDVLADKTVQFGAPMRQLGFSFEETSALLGSFEKQGVNSEKVMAGMQQSLGRMAKAGKDPQKEFKRLTEEMKNAGTAGEANAIAVELFGTRAGPDMAAAVREGRFEIDDLMATLEGSEETIMGAGADTMDFAEKWTMFKNDILQRIEPAATKLFNAIGDGMDWITTVAVPAIEGFAASWSNYEGTAGKVRTALDTVWTVLKGVGGWLIDNKETVIAFVGALATMFIINKVTTAVKAFNVVLRANPIGLVITAIAALVAALVWLYNNNEDARRIMDAAWAKIKSVVQAVVNWFVNTAWPWMRDTFTNIGNKASSLYSEKIKPAWDKIWSIIKAVVSWVKDTAWPWMRDTFGNISGAASTLKDKAVAAFDGIKSGISTAWDGAKKIFDKFKGGLNSLRDRFSTIKSSIINIWGSVARGIGKPINSAIEFFNSFLSKLENAINKIPGVNIDLPTVPTIPLPPATVDTSGKSGGGGGGSAYLASGGSVPGWSPTNTADNIPAWLTAQEFVTRRWAALRMARRHPGALEYINRYGELPGYASGGRVRKPRTGGGLGDVWDAVIGAGKTVIDFVGDPIGTLKKVAGDLLGALGDSWPAQVLTGVGKSMIDKIAGWVKDKFLGGDDGKGPRISGSGWSSSRIASFITALDPTARITSTYRPGARTASGVASFHGLNRAADFVSANITGTMRRLAATGLPWSEAYYSPWGFMRRGRMVPRSQVAPVTIRNHYDHGHLAMAGGGVVDPLLFDRGGYLPTGLSVVNNQTGRPEPLANTDHAIDLSPDTIRDLIDGLEGLLLATADRHARTTRRLDRQGGKD